MHDPDEMPPAADAFLNAGEVILVDGFQVDLGYGAKIGEALGVEPEPSFFVRLEGRVNHSTERRSIRVVMNAEHGYHLGEQIMARMEEFVAAIERPRGEGP